MSRAFGPVFRWAVSCESYESGGQPLAGKAREHGNQEALLADELLTCPLCSRVGAPLHTALRDRSFAAPGRWSLLTCPGCELVWLNPRPRTESLSALYNRYFTHTAAPPDSWLQRCVHRQIPQRLGHRLTAAARAPSGVWDQVASRILTYVGPLRELAQQSTLWLEAERRGRLLDVGCGTGILLTRMRDFGWEVAGIEIDPVAAELAERALGPDRVHLGSLEDSEFADESFDAVVLNHAIEHLLDPTTALDRCFRILKPGGRLVLATPNTAALGRHHFGPHWLHWDPPRHLQLFNVDNLSRLVDLAGFEIVRCLTPSTSAPMIWRGSTLIRRRGQTLGVDLSAVSIWTKLASVVFWGREYLLNFLGRACGEDLVVIAEKPGRWRQNAPTRPGGSTAESLTESSEQGG